MSSFLISASRVVDHVVKNSCKRFPFDKLQNEYSRRTLFRPVKTHRIGTIVVWYGRTLLLGQSFVCGTFVLKKIFRQLSTWLKNAFRRIFSLCNLIVPVFLWPLAHMSFRRLKLGSKIDGFLPWVMRTACKADVSSVTSAVFWYVSLEFWEAFGFIPYQECSLLPSMSHHSQCLRIGHCGHVSFAPYLSSLRFRRL